MDTERASKRRRLDNSPSMSPNMEAAGRNGRQSSKYENKKPGFQTRKSPDAERLAAHRKLSAHEAWAEAKAKSLAARRSGKRAERDIYAGNDGVPPSSQKKAATTVHKKLAFGLPKGQAVGSPARKTPVKSHTIEQHTHGIMETAEKLISQRASARAVAARQKARRHVEAQQENDERVADPMEVDDLGHTQEQQREESQAPVAKPSKDTFTTSMAKAQQSLKSGMSNPSYAFEGGDLKKIQTVIVERLTGKRPIPLTNLSDEYDKVSVLVTQTITAGESNSMLLIGARGSGKTALINQILRGQPSEHSNDFHVVRLNGFIHTDDKIALREIWRQLGREMESEEDESSTRNYADTLTSLLALLAHPAEQGREQVEGQVTKSVIFILDEFELFANHPRQTLLYNLFDIAQSRKAPIAVLGLTTRVDVSEALEKRVKSRFSHRYVHLELAKSFAAYQKVCKVILSVDEPQSAGVDCGLKKLPVNGGWRAVLETLLESEVFTNHLRRLYYTTKSVPDFMTSMLLPIATMPIEDWTDSGVLTDHLLKTLSTSSLSPPDSKLILLRSLSTLQIALLICAARLTNVYDTEMVSFLLAYEEYKVLASKARLQATSTGSAGHGAGARIGGRDVAKDAWEALVDCGLVMMDGKASNGRVDVGLEEIGMCGVELGGWGRWCKEI